jgi:hypothetical protein
MTPGIKAVGLFNERLKGAFNTVNRLKAAVPRINTLFPPLPPGGEAG